MKTKEIHGERFISMCMYHKEDTKYCHDRAFSVQDAQALAKAAQIDISNISHGLCSACKEVLDAEIDIYFNNI